MSVFLEYVNDFIELASKDRDISTNKSDYRYHEGRLSAGEGIRAVVLSSGDESSTSRLHAYLSELDTLITRAERELESNGISSEEFDFQEGIRDAANEIRNYLEGD